MGSLDTLLLVVLVAAAWHVGLTVLERRINRGRNGHSLARLLLLAEVEVLHALRAELRRSSKKDGCDEKLSQVEQRLKELGEDGA